MAKKVLMAAQGVTLTEVSLSDGAVVVERAYHVATRRTPETWDFTNLAEAEAGYHAEVAKSERGAPA